jgi:thiol-disulfide isomerase/thioredoxin
MKQRIHRHLFALAAVAAIVAGAPAARAQEGGIMVGATAPSAKVVMLDGMAADLSRFYGDKPVVLEFWATWCPLCKSLEPAMQAAREKHAGTVVFVSVGVPNNQTAMRQKEYREKQKLGGEFVFDQDGAAVKAFAVPHTSYVVVIDKHRKVVYTGVGEKQDIEAAIQKATGMMQ